MPQDFLSTRQPFTDEQAGPAASFPVPAGRDLLYRLHCLGRNSFNLSLFRHAGLQGFLVSCQHSGTHWLKWMLSHALAHHYGIEPPLYINFTSPGELIGHPRQVPARPGLPRIGSAHPIAPYALQWRWARRLRPRPPYAVIIRDVHDVLLSNYEKWRAKYAVPFGTYLAGDPRGRAYSCDVWWYMRFANRWGEMASRFPAETMVLRYEDIRQSPGEALQRLAQHFRLKLSGADIAAGLAVGSKEVMARHQDPAIQEPVRPDGEGSAFFTPQDRAALSALLQRHLHHDFGYAYFAAPRGFQPAGRAIPPSLPPG